MWGLGGAALALGALRIWDANFGFKSQVSEDYADRGPLFDIRRDLDGAQLCEGIIYGPSGKVVSRFEADMVTVWTGDEGLMNEEFRYDSGEVQHRQWQLKLTGNGTFEARAADVLGVGRGRQAGLAVRLTYRICLPQDAGGHVLRAVDWMYRLENGTIMNRSQFSKFGIKVAELCATIRKKP